ncbi:hypothetical protein [Glaciihabitans sp. UYNi722]|uniref:hypothetical protein n=1 Tax=Glaciihabitans sp. UYNi722 TaxID=3156344 RepID=UPI003399F306
MNADPFHYAKYRAGAVAVTEYLATLTGGATAGGCQMSGDAKTVAAGLIVAMADGSLRLE